MAGLSEVLSNSLQPALWSRAHLSESSAHPGCPRPESGQQIPELPWGQDMMSSWGKRRTLEALHLLHVWRADASLVCAWEPLHRAHVAPSHLPPSFTPLPEQGPPKGKNLTLSSRLNQSEDLLVLRSCSQRAQLPHSKCE